MAIASAGNLIDALRQHRLLTADQLAQLPALCQGRTSDARTLCRRLAQRGWLTVYQVNQLLHGNGKELAWGPYRVLDRLGQGGLSLVFKARHIDYDLMVALKVIKPEALASLDGRQQFLQEIEAMVRLDHPNVVQFCDADQHGDTCYFAMEFVDGTDLGKHVRLTGPLPVRDACDCIRQAALGLQHAHERSLVHRDIKPVNLFLTHVPAARVPAAARSGQPARTVKARPLVKILDWGLAALRDPRGDMPQLLESLSKGLIGTADYLSPEQARNANTVDIRGDLYSLGCTFYHLLTGQPPFPDGTLMQKIIKHQREEPPPIEQFRDDLPAGIPAILRRMMAKDPADRFQTPAALALALQPFARADAVPLGITAPTTKNAPAAVQKDDTPLPVALGGKPSQMVPRLGKIDPKRSQRPESDTARA